MIVSRKWATVYRNFNKFTKNNSEWLNTPFKIPIKNVTTSSVTGRPNIPYASCFQRKQRQKVKTAITHCNMTAPQIIRAAIKKLFTSGKRSAAQLLEEMQLTSNRAITIKNKYKYSKYPNPYTLLAFIIETSSLNNST